MPRAIPAAIIQQMDAVGKRPVLLLELGLASTLRYAAYKSNITFEATTGNPYTAKAIEVSGLSQSLEGQIGRITIKFDNVMKDMAAYANHEDFRGKSLIIKRIYLDSIVNATDYNEVFNGTMERPSEIGPQWLTVTAVSGKPLNRKVHDFAYQRMCPWRFGGTECNTNGLANLAVLTASGTADSGSTTTLVDNALTQASDFWNNGEIQITKSGVVYYRTVKDFVANVAARGTVTMTGIAIANETFVIDSQTFTWKAARTIAGEVTIGTTAAEAVTNIVTAVTADLATVAAVDGTGDTVVVTAVTKGTVGNSIVFTEASTNMAVDGTGTLGATTAGADSITTFDVEMPFAIDNTCTYVVKKGCDQTWDTCTAVNAWGPSGNNSANFGGCIHVSSKQDAE